MTGLLAFWMVFGSALAAVVVSLVAEMLGREGLARGLAALLLIGGGCVGVFAGWTLSVRTVYDTFLAGGTFSTIPGVILLLAGVVLLATESGEGATSAALVSGGAAGAALAGIAVDLTGMLVGIEMAAVCAYALVMSARTPRSSEAGMKYFVQGAVATGLFVLGMSVLVGLFASDARLASVMQALGTQRVVPFAATFGVMAIVGALGFKSGAAPFHSWAPDAYETSAPTAAGFLAGAMKLGMLSALALVLMTLGRFGQDAQHATRGLLTDTLVVLGLLAVASIVVGSTVALTTGSFRRMLAYAGVAQVGYALVAMASLSPSAALFFTVTYAGATTAAFVAAEHFAHTLRDWDGSIAGLAGVGRRDPVPAAALAVALISLAGIPPLLGFWGKLQAFASAVRASIAFSQQGEPTVALVFAALATVGIVGSVVSLGYYGNVIRVMFFTDPAPVHEAGEPDGEPVGARPFGSAKIALIALAALLVVLGVMPLFMGISAISTGFLAG